MEVFEQTDSDAIDDNAQGITAPKSSANSNSEWLATLVKRFKKIDRVHCEPAGWRDHATNDFAAIVFTVSDKERDPYYKIKKSKIQTFVVTLDCRIVMHERVQRRKRIGRYFASHWVQGPAREGLWLMECPVVGDEPKLAVPIIKVAQIERFIEAIKSRQDRNKLRQTRNFKISKLKQTALISKLSDLAKIHQFSFRIGYGVRDVTLSICLDKAPSNERASFFHLAFPHGKFDNVLEQAPAVIESLKELAARGMSFQSNNNHTKELQSKWVETRKLKSIRKRK